MPGKIKRLETSSSRSSSRDLISPVPTAGHRCQTHHAKVVNVGCMSGIFDLVSNYHTRRKFLTFAKTSEKQLPTLAKPSVVTCQSHDNDIANSAKAVEKRRKLEGALEKCDEDLNALKRIIEVVRVSQTPPPKVVHGKIREKEVHEKSEKGGPTPSPVSVLHFPGSPPFTPTTLQYGQRLKREAIQKQRIRGAGKLKAREDHIAHFSNLYILNNRYSSTTNSGTNIRTARIRRIHSSWSKAVVESVEEVCRDVEWGFILEADRLGLLMSEELLQELTKDLMMMLMTDHNILISSTRVFGLPFEGCKRKLWF